MTEYNEGDTIEATKGDVYLRGKLSKSVLGSLGILAAGWTIQGLTADGFTITVIEKATPKVVLPNEPGVYKDREGDIWVLDLHGEWMCPTSPYDNHRALEYAPFTRLEPVPVTAKKVLAAVRKVWPLYNHSELDEIAADLGIEL